MFASQFKKITPFNLLLGSGISLTIILAVFFGEEQQFNLDSFFNEPLFFWLGIQLLSFFMIGVEIREKISYFSCFPLLVFGLTFLWLPVNYISLTIFIEVGFLFWVFHLMLKSQKNTSGTSIFNLTLMSVLLVFYDAAHFSPLFPLFLFFMARKLFSIKALIAFIVPLGLVTFFLYSIGLYWDQEMFILKWSWEFNSWDIQPLSFADSVGGLFIIIVLLLIVRIENLKKSRLLLQTTFGLLLWLLAALVLGFFFSHHTYSRWDWIFCPTVLLISHILMNMKSDRQINMLLGIIFVGGILTRIYIL